jgi:DNA-binding NarL/FixJ family response regulator
VLVVDDQRVVREGLTMLIGLIDGVEVSGAAADGIEALELAREQPPDVVLMDLRMPRMDGVRATREILAALPDTRVLVLTTYADDESLFPALQAGARGYMTKDASAEEIEQAIRALAAGRTHLEAAVQQRLVEALQSAGATSTPAVPAPAGAHVPASAASGATAAGGPMHGELVADELTARETEVLQLIAAGLSNAEIAARLVVSAATVKTHVNRIFSKTGARDRAQAVRYAYRTGLASSGEAPS